MHSIRRPKIALPQHGLGTTKSSCNLRKVPNWLDCRLAHDGLSSEKQDLAIGDEVSSYGSLTRFGQVNLSLPDGDGRTDAKALVEVASVDYCGEIFVVCWR